MSPAAVVLAVLTAVHLPVTTSDAAAQTLFDRGLFFYYAYDGGDAVAVFAQASVRDPALAMAYWGEALADGPDLNTPMTPERFSSGQVAARKAVAFESGAGAGERRYIDAIALRYRGTWADWPRDDAAYRAAMTAMAGRAQATDHDDNASVLAAEALLENGGLGWDGAALAAADSRRALALVNGVLDRDPANVMANHLCIHLYDEAGDRAPARSCAQRLDAAALPPQAEHLAHMPAHYWIETGQYGAAIASSERAYRLFTQLRQIPGRSSDHDRYLLHDTYVGYSAAMMLGEDTVARRWSQYMDAAYETPFDALTALRFGRFADAYALAPDATPADLAARGYAAVELGNLAQARAAAVALQKLSTSGYLAQLFLARLAEREGNDAEAVRWFNRAAAGQADAFSGELIPLLPALELRAGFEMRRGAYAEAARYGGLALAAYPDDPRALFVLAAALQAQGFSDQAEALRSRFAAIWGTHPSPADL